MGDADIKASQWKMVEVGRVVLFNNGPFTGRLAAIVEIIDHKRVLLDGPSSNEKLIVPRHASPLSQVVLTPIIISTLPRKARTGAVKKEWKKAEVEKKWEQNSWAKKADKNQRRRNLSDFERFKAMKLRKQFAKESVTAVGGDVAVFQTPARFEVRKSFAKVRAAAK
ncbi:MAG: hypothetical protein M1833_006305 [Piccolia ochrophora]|nr:MAG: hypothetical protein M1833_006305 [Piccolia ochrophora]